MHEYSLRVRFNECDMYGHVNHATYLQYLESARVALLRDIGLPLQDLQERGIFLVIRRIIANYRESGLLDDDLVVTTSVDRLRRASGTFLQTVFLAGRDHTARHDRRELMSATVDWAAIDGAGRPVTLPSEFSVLRE